MSSTSNCEDLYIMNIFFHIKNDFLFSSRKFSQLSLKDPTRHLEPAETSWPAEPEAHLALSSMLHQSGCSTLLRACAPEATERLPKPFPRVRQQPPDGRPLIIEQWSLGGSGGEPVAAHRGQPGKSPRAEGGKESDSRDEMNHQGERCTRVRGRWVGGRWRWVPLFYPILKNKTEKSNTVLTKFTHLLSLRGPVQAL